MLHALLEYAHAERLAAEPGLKPKWVRWLLLFSPQGQFLGVHDLAGGEPRSKGREFPACPDLTQPEMVAVGSGCRHFLVDSLDVVCLLTKDGQIDAKASARHDFFVGLLQQAARDVPVLAPLAETLRDEAVLATIRAQLAERKAKPTELVTLAVVDVAGVRILVEHDEWRPWWHDFRRRLAEKRKAKAPAARRNTPAPGGQPTLMRCLLSGELVEPLATHNKIEGLADVGGLPTGDALTSFDKDAFGSFGLEQGANAAMSEEMVKTYVTALNHLIRHRSRSLAGVKLVYWYSGPIERDDDPMRELFEGFGLPAPEAAGDQGDADQDPLDAVRQRAHAESRARRLLEAIRSGERPELGDFRFYALTLTGNSGRVVVRDWMEGQFRDLLEAVNAWFDDLAIISIRPDGAQIINSLPFKAVLAAPLRELGDAVAPMVAALWRCALKRQPIPYPIMAQTLQRVRIDLIQGKTSQHARFGLLKAFCNRNERTPKMNPELNEFENHPAYLCGRILAILARIQRVALGDVGAGVTQRYYAAASSTPALVLGRLVRTAQTGHLPKIADKGLQWWLENQLAEVWARFKQAPPPVLTLEEQTLFAMGYYQQIAKRLEKTSDQPADAAVTS